MKSVKETHHYKNAIHELKLDFGNFYLFDCFLVAEIHPNIELSWHKHFNEAVKMVYELYNKRGLVYISNRINPYTLNPSDWIRFFKCGYSLLGYGIVSDNKKGLFSAVFEKIFMRSKMRTFTNLDEAIAWAKILTEPEVKKVTAA